MERIKQSSIALILFGLLLCGCKTIDNTAGRTLITTTATVDAAMDGWATYVVLNDVSIADQESVRHAYNYYSYARKIATAAYAQAQDSKDPALLDALETVIDARESLVGLINQITKGN